MQRAYAGKEDAFSVFVLSGLLGSIPSSLAIFAFEKTEIFALSAIALITGAIWGIWFSIVMWRCAYNSVGKWLGHYTRFSISIAWVSLLFGAIYWLGS